ncbi:D-tyrosyl-tRNA deacylase [Cavenderia fasciculata]|uniref:D-aminoacyl-tRNA deacylase n=1 Tax=Cavenderia fasciculata TaxID=261658 RepID=F4PIH4_CACFS|nr:D-tyrosyl-tRNA deacylase [Cavenderia fasciculata]EGG25403.1 D-tyrosyl-tRNA deacylase [Cavenderia fasciculata]|eukprot:XP_004363254.1 D-tyrosyl-tRNA deacylase [Cavenderia fasciculata]
MRAVIQRVKQASVTVDGQVVSSIGPGLMWITKEDTKVDCEYLLKKIFGLKLWPNPESDKSWDKSVKDLQYEVLFVSQFTLYATTSKGLKPDFHLAAGSEYSKAFYEEFLVDAKKIYNPERIKDGQFGAMMDVGLVNDGPVTISLDSKNK